MTTLEPLRIGVLGLGGRHWMGGAEYTRNLVTAVVAANQEGEIDPVSVSILHTPGDRTFHDQFHGTPGVSLVPLPEGRNGFGQRVARRLGLAAYDRKLSWRCRELGLQFLYPYDGDPKSLGIRTAAWIADFQHLRLPAYFAKDDIELRNNRFRSIAASATTVVLSSETAAGDFKEFYPSAGHKATVLPFRVSIPKQYIAGDPAGVVQKYNLPERFFLVSNQFWQHKNHLLLLNAIQLAVRTNPRVNVVLTGHVVDQRNPGFTDEVLAKIQSLGIHNHVRVLGLIPKHDQVQLMRSAVVVQPSLFEGWNTAVEETLALGRPLIVSDIGTHREQCGAGATYFCPHSAVDLAAKLVNALSSRDCLWDADREANGLSDYAPRIREFGRRFAAMAGR